MPIHWQGSYVCAAVLLLLHVQFNFSLSPPLYNDAPHSPVVPVLSIDVSAALLSSVVLV
jgi:hypothetical protein